MHLMQALNDAFGYFLFYDTTWMLRKEKPVNLELKHIDRSLMQLFIKNAKGKKDSI